MQIFINLNAKLILQTLRILHTAQDTAITQPDKSDILVYALRG